ncbi:putative nrps-like enzyme protein [Corynascus novoguineensis]|uniref:Nrps-like enzyme protein n=1 Tax=Corynascus novoguineensis TaxID=1126955 RepID=A0AAN7CQ60_9PEZI|nr:putative nrps-like enzyme protein [Corynascus novoguineensis]
MSQKTRRQDEPLPHVVDRLAQKLPDSVYGEWPVLPTSYDAGFYAVTYAQLANVVNGIAWWLVDELGSSGETGQVLAYIGPNDVRLTALILAAVKTGHFVFFTSPRNSPVVHQALFDRLSCTILITPDPVPTPSVPVLEAVQPRHLTIPRVDELLDKMYTEYHYAKSFVEARWDPLFIIHTSGSTGIPKPLTWTHESVARHHRRSALAAPDGFTSLNSAYLGKRVLNTLPPFHGHGLAQYMLYGIPFGSIVTSPAPATVANAHGVVEALKQSPADVALLVPSIVAELAQSPELLDYYAEHLERIVYIGGDLPQALGDRVAASVPLSYQYGTSEIGIPNQLLPADLAPSGWHYTCFYPQSGFVFGGATGGACELVVRRDETLADVQLMFGISELKHLEIEYRSRDLFTPYPTVPDAWCWQARADDIIVFLNGEKTNPISMEQYIVAHAPELSGALVLGAQRFQAALLIEPARVDRPLTTAEQAALIERVWPIVEGANHAAPTHARVEKTLILVTTPDCPLIRTPKGTIQRTASVAQYAANIERLYLNADIILTGSTGALGTLLLHALVNRPGVGHIFCLNRSPDGGRAAQANRFAAAGFATDVLGNADRISFLQADLSRPTLGLSDAVYASLCAYAGLVIHNAWPQNMRVVFVSSVAAVGRRLLDAGPVHFVIFEEPSTRYPNGYLQSKFVAELMCDSAARHLGLPVSVLRVG